VVQLGLVVLVLSPHFWFILNLEPLFAQHGVYHDASYDDSSCGVFSCVQDQLRCFLQG